MRKIFWAGDSTAAFNTYETFPQCGLSQGMPAYLAFDVVVLNHAVNGRSTKSFLDEGRFEIIKREIGTGDYLFIQFGHNDEKTNPAVYAAPYGAYQENLKMMIDAAKERGAYPVLITSLYRRLFEGDKLIEGTHGQYPDAMKELAEKEQAPCIDLCSKSYQLIQRTGDEESKKWFMNFPAGRYENYPEGMKDNTHLRYEGAVAFAGLIAEGLRQLGGHYRELLTPSMKGIVAAADGSGDFKTIGEALEAVKKQDEADLAAGREIKPVTIYIKPGVYEERLEIDRPYLTLEGSREKYPVITGGLYANMMMEDGMKRGTFRSYSVFVDTHDFTARHITFENSAGPRMKVGQALALYADGDRLFFDECRLLSGQDTLFTGPLPPKEIVKNGFIGPKQYAPRINGRHFYQNCYIEGDVDFIFGSATAYFKNCELFSKNVGKEINSYVTAASTPEGQEYGYVFEGCRFTGNCPEHSAYLGRPWRNYAKTVILNSDIGPHICREGWHDWNKEDARATVYYAEYGNTGESADMSLRPSWVVRLEEKDLEMFSRQRVLAGEDGWDPTATTGRESHPGQ